jgi:hypothetical protein
VSKNDFNWGLLTKRNLYSMMYSAGKDIVGKKMSVASIQKHISSHLKSHLPIKVTKRQNDPSQKRGLVYLGGAYYSEYDKNNWGRYIEIVLCYHPLDERVRFTEYRWQGMCSLFADTILHEVIHLRQYRARNFKDIVGYESTAHYARDRKEQEYYGHRDEMGAFAFNIACEMISRFGDDRKAIQKYMDSMQCKRRPKSTYNQYLKAFDYNHNHNIIRRMKKKILAQIDNAVLGKPFKTQDHLTY